MFLPVCILLIGSTPSTVDIVNNMSNEADAEKDVNELYTIILHSNRGTYPEQQINISKLQKMHSAIVNMDVQVN